MLNAQRSKLKHKYKYCLLIGETILRGAIIILRLLYERTVRCYLSPERGLQLIKLTHKFTQPDFLFSLHTLVALGSMNLYFFEIFS